MCDVEIVVVMTGVVGITGNEVGNPGIGKEIGGNSVTVSVLDVLLYPTPVSPNIANRLCRRY